MFPRGNLHSAFERRALAMNSAPCSATRSKRGAALERRPLTRRNPGGDEPARIGAEHDGRDAVAGAVVQPLRHFGPQPDAEVRVPIAQLRHELFRRAGLGRRPALGPAKSTSIEFRLT